MHEQKMKHHTRTKFQLKAIMHTFNHTKNDMSVSTTVFFQVCTAPTACVLAALWHPRSHDPRPPNLRKCYCRFIDGIWIQHHESVLLGHLFMHQPILLKLKPMCLHLFLALFSFCLSIPTAPTSLVTSSLPSPSSFASLEPPTPLR